MTNLKLVKIYVDLDEMKQQIANEILPTMQSINFPDKELYDKLAETLLAIENHISAYEVKDYFKN